MGQQRLAWLFPGQGTQAVGMGQALYDSSTAARALMDLADATLGGEVLRRCFDGPADELRLTLHAQPAIVIVSLASLAVCFEALTEGNLEGTPEEWFGSRLPPELAPAFVAGHSVGELAALIATGALSLVEGLRLVQARARAMQEAGASRPGTMTAVLGLTFDEVDAACAAARAEVPGSYVTVATHNEPTQVVIAGDQEGLAAAGKHARERGARRVVRLEVSAAFHSAAMHPAAEALAAPVASLAIQPPLVPVVLNTSAQPTRDPESIRAALTQQVRQPVRWADTVGLLLAQDVTLFLECGPGQVLINTIRRRSSAAETWAVSMPDDVGAAMAGLRAHWG
ncbi:MAG: malonyl CoA-acyl carrier protein transacylase [Dehalococcoidia bacterium]|nr:malonyl CoA-acyl carrier protein transacylase [Dehalococcoidia bacterium]